MKFVNKASKRRFYEQGMDKAPMYVPPKAVGVAATAVLGYGLFAGIRDTYRALNSCYQEAKFNKAVEAGQKEVRDQHHDQKVAV